MPAAEAYLDDTVQLHCGDMLAVLATLAENSIDSCVTDPPYHLQSIVKRFAKNGRTDKTRTTSGPHQRTAAGFMNQMWDGGDIAFRAETWAAVYRVLKPGAYLLAFGGTRTYHRIASAIEDAGFIVYDMIGWAYGQGFPKSHNISKAIDRELGVEREVVGVSRDGAGASPGKLDNHGPGDTGIGIMDGSGRVFVITAPASDEARQWNGWGTALKPAMEPVCLARKPIDDGCTIAENVLRWGTGALNIDACRIEGPMDGVWGTSNATCAPTFNGSPAQHDFRSAPHTNGRWPANIIHDGSPEALACFPDCDGVVGGCHDPNGSFGYHGGANGRYVEGIKDTGSAARFFYTAKADADDRLGSKHPTVKPLDLIRYLVRLVTPPGGLTLDPFAGTGTAGEAAWREGMRAVLIEREAAYCIDIRRRMALARSSDRERVEQSIKAAGKTQPPGPLFAGLDRAEAAE